jgi:hypothetical protein
MQGMTEWPTSRTARYIARCRNARSLVGGTAKGRRSPVEYGNGPMGLAPATHRESYSEWRYPGG